MGDTQPRSFVLPVGLLLAGLLLLMLAYVAMIPSPGAALEPETAAYAETTRALRPWLSGGLTLGGVTCLVFGVRTLRRSVD